jgi:C4-dicarboxylate transporter
MSNLPVLSRSELVEKIEQTTFSADAKAILIQIADTTVRIGQTVVAIGRQLLTFVLDLFRQFPNTAFGLIISSVLAALVVSTPFIGAAFGAILAPLLVALGIAKGALVDLDASAMANRYAAFHAELAVLQAQAGK